MPYLFRRSACLTIAVAALFIVLASAIVRFVVWQRMARSIENTMQAAEIQADLDALVSLIQEAEAGQRGFILTSEGSFLEDYDRAVKELPEHFTGLETMLAGRPDAVNILRELHAAVDSKITDLSQTVELFRNKEREQAITRVADGNRTNRMDRIRALIGRVEETMPADFAGANKERRARMASAVWWTNAAGISGILAGLAALFMYFLARRLASAEASQERRAEIAEQVGKHKSSFLASMSHEIRTPMNAVLGFTELMEAEPLSEKQQSFLYSIKQAGQSLIQLINDILDLSKVEAGMIDLNPQPTDLREAGEFVRTVLGQVCAAKGVDLRIDIPRSIPRGLLLDEGRVRQILVNLAGNAARFTEHGFVRVSAEAQYPVEDRKHVTIILKVQDTGVGIPAEKLITIFEPFVQADSRRHPEKHGTGLGLSIVKRLTGLMGGTVSVESEPGRGSTFTVVLPRVEIPERAVPIEPAVLDVRANMDDLQPSEILVVDDNPVNRDLLAGIFEGTHHQVRFATNGLEALHAMSEKKPGLVLMDVRMPVMTGTEALEKMRLEPGLRAVPVIAVTASSLLHDEGGLRRRFNGYLRKPFSRAELYREIAQFIPRQTRTATVRLPDLSAEGPESEAQAAAWQTAVRKLRQFEATTWPALQKCLAITEANDFAARLRLLAEAADCPPLRSYAETLRKHAGRFAADDLEKHLAAFPQLITLLETRITHILSHAAQ